MEKYLENFKTNFTKILMKFSENFNDIVETFDKKFWKLCRKCWIYLSYCFLPDYVVEEW